MREELKILKNNNVESEWCICGDFNAVVNSRERKGTHNQLRRAKKVEFKQFIEETKLIDVPLLGKWFTWFSTDDQSMGRLDRFFLSKDAVDMLKVVGQQVGDRDISDHCPIWLKSYTIIWGPKPFIFNNCWIEHQDFLKNLWKVVGKDLMSQQKGFHSEGKIKSAQRKTPTMEQGYVRMARFEDGNIVADLNFLDTLTASYGNIADT